MTTSPHEPPFAGTETEALVGALDRLRATFRWKADGLDAAGLDTTIGASVITLGGLLKHLALVEDDVFGRRLSDAPFPMVWREHDGTDDWSFTSAARDTPEQLYAFWDDAVARSRERLAAALERGDLGQEVHLTWGEGGPHANLRRLVCDLVEEYGRHTGHADLIREAVDGRVGEDVPPDWTPVGPA